MLLLIIYFSINNTSIRQVEISFVDNKIAYNLVNYCVTVLLACINTHKSIPSTDRNVYCIMSVIIDLWYK